jgi:hypothetical protein
MADQTPTWLSDSVGGSAPAVPQDAIESVPIDDVAAASSGGALEVASAPEAEEKDLPHVILMMRLANMGAACALIACAVRTKGTIMIAVYCYTMALPRFWYCARRFLRG